MSKERFCPECGQPVNADERFCPDCGAEVPFEPTGYEKEREAIMARLDK